MNAMRRIVLGLALAADGSVLALGAQQPPAIALPTEPQVTFKVEINYVEVDAAVFDRQRRLRPRPATRRLRGHRGRRARRTSPRSRRSTSRSSAPNRRRCRPQPVIEPDVVSNARPFEGRVYVIILDDKHTRRCAAARPRAPPSSSSAATWPTTTWPQSSRPAARAAATQEFTSNKRLLLRAVNKFIGQKLRSETEERLDEYQRQQRVTPGNIDADRTTRSTCSAATTRASRSRRWPGSRTGSAAFAAVARRSSSSARASTTTSTTSTSARPRRSRKRCARSSPRPPARTSASTRSTRAASPRLPTRRSRSRAAFPPTRSST